MTSATPPQRSRRTVWAWVIGIAIVLAVAAAFIGPRIYAATQEGNAAPEPTITPAPEPSAGEASGEPSASAAAELAGTWQVAAGSYAGYRVEEVLNGADVTVVGRTENVTGSIVTTEETVTEAAIEVDVASITTDQPNRDEYFAGEALETATYPTATFTLTEPAEAPGDVVEGSTHDVQLVGELTLHGVTQSVTVEAQVAIGADSAQVVGTIPITFADYGVEAPSLGFVSVEPAGAVEFSLQLTR